MKKTTSIIILLILLLTIHVLAQSTLNNGDTLTASLSDEVPVLVYTIRGNAGDTVSVQAVSLRDDLQLVMALQQGIQTLQVSDSAPFTPDEQDVRLDVRLPATGVYLLIVSSATGQTGDFVLHVRGVAIDSQSSTLPIPEQITLTAGVVNTYTMQNETDMPQVLTLRGATTDFVFQTTVYNRNGSLIQMSIGSTTLIVIPPFEAVEILLRGADGTVFTALSDMTLPALSEVPVSPQAPAHTQTMSVSLEIEPTPTLDETDVPIYETPFMESNAVCGIYSGGFPNIRTGPGTNFTVVTQVQPDVIYTVVGVYTNWYQIFVPAYGSGWVRDDVVGIGGNCSSIPALPPDNTPVLPSRTPTSTRTPTVTPTATATSTATATATATITASPTASDTPPPTATPVIQVAPVDTNFNSPLMITLGGMTSVSDFVSFPDGDREDQIQWDIMGMSQAGTRAQLTITATCFGDVTDTIVFTVDNETYACGDVIVDREVTADTRTGAVTITATGGDNIYVQWILRASTTRLN